MAPRDPDDIPLPVYDVLLDRTPPEHLRSDFPSMSTSTTPSQTMLRCLVRGPGQLDRLIETVFAWGLPLVSVHRLPDSGADADLERGVPAYEVCVDGEVGGSVARHLRWARRCVPRQTRVRVAVTPGELPHFLRACTEGGASIQRVTRVSPRTGDVPAR